MPKNKGGAQKMAPYSKKRLQLMEALLRLWDIHAETYRTNPLRYQFLLAAKRELHIAPLNKIKQEVLLEYPEVPFFKILDKPSAMEAIKSMSDAKLRNQIYSIEYTVSYNHAYRTIYNRVMEFTYEINHYGDNKSEFGVEPKSCLRQSLYNRCRAHKSAE